MRRFRAERTGCRRENGAETGRQAKTGAPSGGPLRLAVDGSRAGGTVRTGSQPGTAGGAVVTGTGLIAARIVKAHPLPTPSIMGWIAALAPAPTRQRVKLLLAVAALAAVGFMSTMSVLTTLLKPVKPTPARNSITQGTARCA